MEKKISTKKFVEIFLLALGTIAIAEILARIVLWIPPGTFTSASTDFGIVRYGYSAGGRGDLAPNQNGIWLSNPHRPYSLQTNSVGLRNVEELSQDENTLRILAIGDSFTFGPYVENEDTWPAQLETSLNTRFYPTKQFEVLNAGISGYTAADQLEYLREKGLALNPDLVLLGVFPNDIIDYRPHKRAELGRPDSAIENTRFWLANYSALYTGAKIIGYKVLDIGQNREFRPPEGSIPASLPQQYDMLFVDTDDPEVQLYREEYEEDLRETIRLLEENNIPFGILIFPMYEQLPEEGFPDYPQQFVIEIAEDTQTPYLDLLPIFQTEGEIETLYLLHYDPTIAVPEDVGAWAEWSRYEGDGHLSRYGYYVTAQAVADFLVSANLVADPVN